MLEIYYSLEKLTSFTVISKENGIIDDAIFSQILPFFVFCWVI
ncbi:hypothetical protein APHDU1_0026 [Anaplasma phagocytophilum]|uniref:Uncharacterized protein n=1 Tax=Anaplasma phagocytophilum (strain HZ) TaxID=212042 RepID=Q2GJY8_ANAPZ|nr:hypothetical protein APH_0733 [Anaplasma phagocytophilum str. HZ]KJV83056.1 hypothetical protein APHHGE2_1027 [Anaplasma phagocytophilum str. HGE2]KKA00033.1 hypothetical protein APHDU1_0026 [Anaplasma phagocytophilum]